MKKDIWIVVIILCVLGILAVIYKVWQDGKNGLLEKFEPTITVEAQKYTHLNNNLVTNGSFADGKKIVESTGSVGDTDIIIFQNSGQSSYVLKQTSTKSLKPTDPIFYKLELKLKSNTVFYMGCLYLSTKNLPLRNVVIFNRNQKITLKTLDEPNYTLSKQSVNDFKYKYCLFKTPISENDDGKIDVTIYLSFNFNNMQGFNYITDVGIFELLNVETYIPVNDDLRSYINPFNPQSTETNSKDIRDLTNNGFDFKASIGKQVNRGNIDLDNNVLTGPNCFKLQNKGIIKFTNNFTFFIYVRGMNRQTQVVENFADNDKTPNPANMTYEDFKNLWQSVGCQGVLGQDNPKIAWWQTQTYENVINDMRTTCNASIKPLEKAEEVTQLQIQNPARIIPTRTSKQYSTILATYDGIELINFFGNQSVAIGIITPKTYGPIILSVGGTFYESFIKFPSFSNFLLAIMYDGNTIRMFNNGELILEAYSPKVYFDNNPVIINPNGKFLGDFYAFAYYNKNLRVDQISQISRYFVKMVAIGKETSILTIEMQKFVESFKISEITPTEEEQGYYNIKSKSNLSPIQSDTSQSIANYTDIIPNNQKADIKPSSITPAQYQNAGPASIPAEDYNYCPKVIYEDGHYYAIIQNDSDLSKKLGYSGIRDYGTNIDNAKKIYQTNFPKCKVPDILERNKYRGNLKECPFVIINNENPCNVYDCKDVDWKKGTTNNTYCKRAVDNYCSKYYDVDDACFCWKPENKNSKACLKWRGQFDSPDKCDFRKYPIETHPDADKYIRKDKIPCWGCNLTAPESTGNYSCKK